MGGDRSAHHSKFSNLSASTPRTTNSIFVLGLYQAATQDAVEMMIYLTPIF